MAVPERAMQPPRSQAFDVLRFVKNVVDGAIQHKKRAALIIGGGVGVGFLYFSGQGVVIADQLRGALGLPEPQKGNPTQKFIGDRPTNLGSHATNDILSVDGSGDSGQGPDAPAAETEVPKGTPFPLLPNTGGGATETFTPTPTRTPTPRSELLAKATVAHWTAVAAGKPSPFFTVTPDATKVAQVEPSATQIVDSTATVVPDEPSKPISNNENPYKEIAISKTFEGTFEGHTEKINIQIHSSLANRKKLAVNDINLNPEIGNAGDKLVEGDLKAKFYGWLEDNPSGDWTQFVSQLNNGSFDIIASTGTSIMGRVNSSVKLNNGLSIMLTGEPVINGTLLRNNGKLVGSYGYFVNSEGYLTVVVEIPESSFNGIDLTGRGPSNVIANNIAGALKYLALPEDMQNYPDPQKKDEWDATHPEIDTAIRDSFRTPGFGGNLQPQMSP